MSISRKYIITFLVLIWAGVLPGQSSAISGRVTYTTDENVAQPVDYANVYLFDLGEQQVVASTLSDDNGDFIFEAVGNENLELICSRIGFGEVRLKFAELAEQGALGKPIQVDLRPEGVTLDALEVKARKTSRIEYSGGGTVVHLDDRDRQQVDLESLLTQLPGIFRLNGKLTIEGAADAKILLNGRPFAGGYEVLMQQITPEQIEKIEIRKQPGAAFSAEGGAGVINIITRQKVDEGWFTTLTARGNLRRDFLPNGSIFSSYGRGKFQITTLLSYGRYQYIDTTGIDRDRFTHLESGIRTRNSVRANFEVFYQPTRLLNLRLIYKYFQNNQSGLANSLAEVFSTDPEVSPIVAKTVSQSRNRWNYNNVDLFLTRNEFFGGTLKMDGTVAWFTPLRNDFIDVSYPLGGIVPIDQQLRYLGDNLIGAVNADYERDLWETGSLRMGGRFSFSDKTDDFSVSHQNDQGEFIRDELSSNVYRYQEEISALYFQVENKWEKVSGAVGLRMEHLDAEGRSSGLDTILDRNRTFLFPYLNLDYELSEKFGFGLSMNSRIQRPNYQNLNPFIVFHDPFTLERGNPLLASAYTNNFAFKLNYRKNPMLEFGIRNTRDFILQVPIQSDDDRVFGETVNIERFRQYKISAYYPIRFGEKLNGYGGVINTWNEYFDAERGLDVARYNVNVFGQTKYDLTDTWSIKGNFWFSSGGLQGPVILDPIAGIGGSIHYQAPLGAEIPLSVTVGNNDILNMASQGEIILNDNQLRVRNRNFPTRFYCSFNWKFGQKLNRTDLRRSGGQAQKNRINWNQ